MIATREPQVEGVAMTTASNPSDVRARAGRVLYVQYTNPAAYPPLEHSSLMLADAGAQIMFLGTHSFGAAALRLPADERIIVRTMSFRSPGWRQKLHYLLFCVWVVYWCVRWRANWIYASDPLAALPALGASFLTRARVVYHEHDAPSFDQRRIFDRATRALRRFVARRAALCVIPQQERLEQFDSEVSPNAGTVCVWNCPMSQDAALPNQSVFDGNLVLFYHGSIVHDRLPLSILRAMARLNGQVRLRIAGYDAAHGDYVREFLDTARALGVADAVEYLGPIPMRQDLLSYCRQAHVGLSLMPASSRDLNMRAMVGASNKPFDYLACGLALLISDLPDWRPTYAAPGYARVCDPDDAHSIAEQLEWFVDHRDQLRAMGESGRQRVLGEWNYERQFETVRRHMLAEMRA